MAVTITSTTDDGTQVEVTISKTGADTGTIQVKKWAKGKDPKKDKPNSDETTKLYDIKTKKDGSKTVCKADVTGSDPDVTIVVNCPDPPKDPKEPKKKPSITITVKGSSFGAGDGTTTYSISEQDQTAILDFLKGAGFPAVASAGTLSGGALALLIEQPDLRSKLALDRVALSLADLANSIRRGDDDWVEAADGLRFVGFDPAVDAKVALSASNAAASLVLMASLPEAALREPQLRYRDEFVHPSRPERVGEFGELIEPVALAGAARSSEECGPAKVTATADSNPNLDRGAAVAEAIKNARDAAQSSCTGKCADNARCRYLEDSITSTSRSEVQPNGQRMYVASATTSGGCHCE